MCRRRDEPGENGGHLWKAATSPGRFSCGEPQGSLICNTAVGRSGCGEASPRQPGLRDQQRSMALRRATAFTASLVESCSAAAPAMAAFRPQGAALAQARGLLGPGVL